MAILQHLMHQSLQNTCCSSQSWDLWCAASVNCPVALRCRMSLSGVIARVFISTYCAAGCTSMCHCARNWTDSGSQDSVCGAVAGGEEAATACSPPSSCSNTNTWTVGVGFSALPSCLIFYSAKGAWRPRHNCIQKKWLLMFTQPFLFLLYLFLTVFSLRPPAASPLDSTLLISSPPHFRRLHLSSAHVEAYSLAWAT